MLTAGPDGAEPEVAVHLERCGGSMTRVGAISCHNSLCGTLPRSSGWAGHV